MPLLLLDFTTVAALVTALLFIGSKPDPDNARMTTRIRSLRSAASEGDLIESDPLYKQRRKESRGLAGRLLRWMSATTELDTLLIQSNSRWSAKHVVLAAVGMALCAAAVAYVLFPAPVVVLLIALPCSYVPIFLLKLQRKRRIGAFEKSLPEVVDTLSRSLRAGHSLVPAISIVAENAPEPARAEFAELFRKQNFGLPLRDAFMQLLERVPSQDLRVLVTGILLQKDAGGDLTQILDHTAVVIRERLKLRGDVRVHTAQGRMTGWILCLLPIVMAFFINLISPGYFRTLTDDPFGRKLLYTGIGLLFIGMFLIRRIVNGIEV